MSAIEPILVWTVMVTGALAVVVGSAVMVATALALAVEHLYRQAVRGYDALTVMRVLARLRKAGRLKSLGPDGEDRHGA